MKIRMTVAIAALLLLAGCSTATPEAVERLVPEPAPTRVGPEIPTQSTAIQPVRQAVPPVGVAIPSLGIDIAIEPVGVEADGLMEVPPDVAIGGWYQYGSDPASLTGTTVIAAHVDSPKYGVGPFSTLKRLAVGETVSVTTADGIARSYVVESVQSIPKTELPLDQVFDRAGAPRLALITCGGQFNSSARSYVDNIVVIATPVVT